MAYRDADYRYYSQQGELNSLNWRIQRLENDVMELQRLLIDVQDLVEHLLREAGMK